MNRVNRGGNRPLIQPVKSGENTQKLSDDGRRRNQSNSQRDKKKNNEFSEILRKKLEENSGFNTKI